MLMRCRPALVQIEAEGEYWKVTHPDGRTELLSAQEVDSRYEPLLRFQKEKEVHV